MHPYALVPLLSFVAAGVLASAVAAREPDRLSNRLGGTILAGAAIWSLFELLFTTAPDAASATRYLRWTSLGSLTAGPLVLHLVASRMGVADERGLRPMLALAYLSSLACVAAAIWTDWIVAGARPASWGWSPVPGAGLTATYGVLAGLPLLGVAGVLWRARARSRLRPRAISVVPAALCFSVASLTDFGLTQLGIPFPRFGSASVVLWGAITWWTVYRFRRLHLSPQKFAREILDTLPDGVALLRLDGRVRTANRRLGELTGRAMAELVGMPIAKLLPELDEGRSSGEKESESELLSADGRRVPVSISRVRLADGDQEPIGQVLLIRDLREVVSLRSRLVSSGRLVAVGQLAAGIAHEINNPIAYVRSNLRMLDRHWKEIGAALEALPAGGRAALAEGPELLRECGDGVDRVVGIVRDVGRFSRGGMLETEAADLEKLLDTALRVAAPQVRRAAIERSYCGLPPIPCVPQELMQVFLNLLINAGQALGDAGGSIRLATRVEGERATVEIADDGPGMDPDVLERIFEPFFTTKPVGRGTGLGLSISQQIVAKHGGALRAASQRGAGTSFRVELPIHGRRLARDAGTR